MKENDKKKQELKREEILKKYGLKTNPNPPKKTGCFVIMSNNPIIKADDLSKEDISMEEEIGKIFEEVGLPKPRYGGKTGCVVAFTNNPVLKEENGNTFEPNQTSKDEEIDKILKECGFQNIVIGNRTGNVVSFLNDTKVKEK